MSSSQPQSKTQSNFIFFKSAAYYRVKRSVHQAAELFQKVYTPSPICLGTFSFTDTPHYLKSGLALRCFTRAISSTTGPLEALIRRASFFILLSRSVLIRCLVFSSRLQCKLTTCKQKSASYELASLHHTQRKYACDVSNVFHKSASA